MDFKFIVVGAGGTGGHLLSFLSRQLSALRSSHELVIIDGDVIERKNISRQPFYYHEIAENKATNLAKKINMLYQDLSVSAYPFYIDNANDLLCHITDDTVMPVIVGCVDNHQARIIMETVFSKLEDIIYIDAANEKFSGEVIVGAKAGGNILLQPRSFYEPEIMTDQGPRKSEEGCQNLVASGSQRLTANLMSATLAFTYCAKLLFGESISKNMIAFDTETMEVRKSYGRYSTYLTQKAT